MDAQTPEISHVSKKPKKRRLSLIVILLAYTVAALMLTTTSGDIMQIAEAHVSSLVADQGGIARANSVSQISGLYIVNLDINVNGQTQNQDVYLTRDGNIMIIGNLFETDKSLKSDGTYEVPRAEIPLGDRELTLGTPDSPVTFVEFSDIECPFCERFYQDGLVGVKKLAEEGKVYFVYKHFPLNFHPEAIPGANAIECAADQGKWIEMHDLIFENQDSLSASIYKTWASQLGLNSLEFNNCFDTSKHQDKIDADYELGRQIGVSGTPASFANGIMISGAQPFKSFEPTILAEIEAANA
jgi:protein-disulfide isomerase|tara:strand:- start:1556 stop:2452 length:897 start_codon:yes stop_codon:yes gene_type:complete